MLWACEKIIARKVCVILFLKWIYVFLGCGFATVI